jgi:hypothetical protein
MQIVIVIILRKQAAGRCRTEPCSQTLLLSLTIVQNLLWNNTLEWNEILEHTTFWIVTGQVKSTCNHDLNSEWNFFSKFVIKFGIVGYDVPAVDNYRNRYEHFLYVCEPLLK